MKTKNSAYSNSIRQLHNTSHFLSSKHLHYFTALRLRTVLCIFVICDDDDAKIRFKKMAAEYLFRAEMLVNKLIYKIENGFLIVSQQFQST